MKTAMLLFRYWLSYSFLAIYYVVVAVTYPLLVIAVAIYGYILSRKGVKRMEDYLMLGGKKYAVTLVEETPTADTSVQEQPATPAEGESQPETPAAPAEGQEAAPQEPTA